MRPRCRKWLARGATWLRATHLGFGVLALVVGLGAGLGAVGFRWLIFAVTWAVTGREQFGQQGRVASVHLSFLGAGFIVVAPVIGGLVYGPLVQRFAREARGHGVPEVMLAVAENGGRIRPQVSIVKALASAICIGTGGSVGREGPIVQIGATLASSLGQLVRLAQSRLRLLVACGAAGAISATFNAPITGVLFGLEIILRELSAEALFGVLVAAVAANVVSRAFFGAAPFFAGVPHGLVVGHDIDYLLILVLGVLAGGIGVGFEKGLYRLEDLCDGLWSGRPEWARPAVGGVALGALLLAVPGLYGVGYPVMDEAFAGRIAIGLVLAYVVLKPLAASVTIGIGGSGGIFAPSLFAGAMLGVAFGDGVHHLFGAAAGAVALYGVVAMGAVFGAATQAPLTAIASVIEMTGNYSLTVAVMLGVASAVGVAHLLTYGTIYTTKLLRRGIDIDRPHASDLLSVLTAADAMQPAAPRATLPDGVPTVAADESLAELLRLLAPAGPQGVAVLGADRSAVVGWITHERLLAVLAERLQAAEDEYRDRTPRRGLPRRREAARRG